MGIEASPLVAARFGELLYVFDRLVLLCSQSSC